MHKNQTKLFLKVHLEFHDDTPWGSQCATYDGKCGVNKAEKWILDHTDILRALGNKSTFHPW
jgi:hypothetical protein